MNTRVRIAGIARANGWTILVPEYQWEVYEYTRRNGQRRETVRVTYDVRDRVSTASWQPDSSGIGGRMIHSSMRGKADRVIAFLTSQVGTVK